MTSPDDKPIVGAAAWIRGMRALFGDTATTNLQRDPDDPYDPDDDLPWTWADDSR